MESSLILLAKIGAAHGIKGEVRVKPYGQPQMLDQYGKLASDDGRTFLITRMRLQKDIAVVKFKGINTRDEAEALNGTQLYVDRAKLPEPDEDEFYISDLIGLVVLNDEGERLGAVKDVPNFGAGDMLEIDWETPGGTSLVPFTRDTVPEIDLKSGSLTLIPPTEVSERDEQP